MTAAAEDYWKAREKFLEEERSESFGADLKLTEKEEQVNHIFMKYKKQEMEEGFDNPKIFPPAMHFFEAKKLIDKSLLFSLIKQMPKGSALHAHDYAQLLPEWVVKNVTYRKHLYACKKDGKYLFLFSHCVPGGEWLSVKQLRKQSCSAEAFDNWLRSLLTLEVENPDEVYKDINVAWDAFMDIFNVIQPILTYRPVFEDYFYAVLQAFYDENILYLELRSTLPDLYELNGDIINGIDSVAILEGISKKFVQDHPDHMGMKVIYAPPRFGTNTTTDKYIANVKVLKERYPHFLAGFDLVGQEDIGIPLTDYVAKLQEISSDVKFFFHAGETNWNGMKTDDNLIDAVLLNTTRIGHGYAMSKHPRVMEEVKKRDIGIEVNPISNQVLMLVKDLRNHPASTLLAQNFPIVIASDDYGFWGASPSSYDFYITFMGLAGADDDIRCLKKAVLNSIKFSTFTPEENERAMKIFEEKWESFLNFVLKQYNGKPDDTKNVV